MFKSKHGTRHGGPYDRGGADSYYGRPRDPHYFVGPTYQSDKVLAAGMSDDEIADYNAGYDANEADGTKKS